MTEPIFIKNDITRDDLFGAGQSAQILDLGAEIIHDLRYFDAKILARELEQKIGPFSGLLLSPLEENYRTLLAKLKMLAFNLWDDNTAIDIFKTSLVESLSDDDVPYMDRVEARMIEIDYDLRDRFKEKLRQAIYLNEQKLTNKYLYIDREEVSGHVKNWIKDYLRNVGSDIVSSLDKAKYLTTSRNVKILNKDEKMKLTELVDLYEYLKLPALSSEGFDEEIVFVDIAGETKRFYRGLVKDAPSDFVANSVGNKTSADISIKIEPEKEKSTLLAPTPKVVAPVQKSLASPSKSSQETPPPLSPEQIMDLYHGGDVERARLKEEDAAISQKTDSDFSKTLTTLIQSIDPPPGLGRNKWAAMAALRQMAKNHQLDELLKNSQINNLLVKYLKAVNENHALDSYLLSPTQPVNFKWLVKCVFENLLKLPETTAARWGLQLSTLAKKTGETKFADLAYFDLKTQKFIWK